MLLFYSKVENPKVEDKKRFDRIKKRIAIVFNKMKRDYEKSDKKQGLEIKAGQNYIAIFQWVKRTL